MESFAIALGRAQARNGYLLRKGNYIEGGARRFPRVCRSSLSAEASATRNAADLMTHIRVLAIETLPGEFRKELCGMGRVYKLNVPFGISPTVETVLAELERCRGGK